MRHVLPNNTAPTTCTCTHEVIQAVPVSPASLAMHFGLMHHLLFVHQAFDWWLIAADLLIYHCWNLNSKVAIASSVLIGLVTGCHFTIICKSTNEQVRLEEKYHFLVGFCRWKCRSWKKHTLPIMKMAYKRSIFAPTAINSSKQTKITAFLWLLDWVCGVYGQ